LSWLGLHGQQSPLGRIGVLWPTVQTVESSGDSGESGQWFLDDGSMVDHFRVIRPLGRGGMAEVYLARDTKLSRMVALKVVRPKALGSAESVQRFLFEARTTARFNHPHIVTVHAVGEHQDRPYVALEYLQGQTLRERLAAHRGSLPVQEAIRIGLAVADALRVAHDSRVLHRDLKPENVMLTEDDQLRVLDFGLARVFHRGDDPAEDPPLPPIGPIPETHDSYELFESMGLNPRGTPAYMAPEQWEEKETTGATDVWALGVMLFEMLTATRPFAETTVFKLAVQVCSEDAPAVATLAPSVPEELSRLVADCLRRRPEQRPVAQEVDERLRAMLVKEISALTRSSDEVLLSRRLVQSAVDAKQRSTVEPIAAEPRPRHRSTWLLAGVLALGLGAIALVKLRRPADSQAPVTRGPSADVAPRARDARALQQPDRAAPRPDAAAAVSVAAKPKRTSPKRPARPQTWGFLTVNAKPWAVVFLDGQRLDVTPIYRRRVPSGRHALELRNPDKNLVQRLTIEIPQDGELKRKVDLLAPSP
jgi:serine/threonine protein kinase